MATTPVQENALDVAEAASDFADADSDPEDYHWESSESGGESSDDESETYSEYDAENEDCSSLEPSGKYTCVHSLDISDSGQAWTLGRIFCLNYRWNYFTMHVCIIVFVSI